MTAGQQSGTGPAPRWAGLAATIILLSGTLPAWGHVPFIEKADWTAAKPFVVKDVSQSKALYGYIESDHDQDFFAMQVENGRSIFLAILVPECRAYADFRVSYALTGPGLPTPAEPLPFALAPGDGAVVVREPAAAGKPRTVMQEYFSNRSYYQGPEFEWNTTATGEYRMVVWQEQGRTGDYVAVIGTEEKFSPADLARAASGTVTIRRGGELHTRCELATAPSGAAD